MGFSPAVVEVERPRAGWARRRRGNRRISVRSRSPLLWVAGIVQALWRVVKRPARVLGKVMLVGAALVACAWGGRLLLRHLVDSPRFQLRTIELKPTAHLGMAEVTALAGVAIGDRLLGIDTDAIAGRIATHPWVKSVHASRRLPGSLVIEVTERRAPAVVALDGLYLVDDTGRPFKRATMTEADGLPVLTGLDRARFAELREVSEAAFREALAVLAEYQRQPDRPAVGEINIDPAFGFSLVLLEGGAEIRLGRGNYGKKLAQLDRILEALRTKGMGGRSALRIVHLDLPESGRVPVLLRGGAETSAPPRREPDKLAQNQPRND